MFNQQMGYANPMLGPPNPQFAVQQGMNPEQPLYVPQINIGPLQQYLPVITGYSMLAAQNPATTTPMRAYFFNIMSSNGWRNTDFNTMVTYVAALADYLAQDRDASRALAEAADIIATMMTCLYVNEQAQYFAQFLDQNAIRIVEEQLQQYAGFMEYFNGYMQNNSRMQQPVQQTFNNQQFNRGGPRIHGGAQIGNQRMPAGPTRMGAGGIWGSTPQQQTGGLGGFAGFGGGVGQNRTHRAPAEEVAFTASGPLFRPIETKPQPIQETRTMPTLSGTSNFGTPTPTAPKFVPILPGSEWPKVANPTRPFDHILLENGIELKPAYQSDWTVTFSKTRPYHLVYDTQKYILFHAKHPDGSVSETLRERTDDMRYIDHELDPELRQKLEDDEPKEEGISAVNWRLAAKFKEHPNYPAANVNTSTLEENADAADAVLEPSTDTTPPVYTDVIQAHTLDEAKVKLSLLVHADSEFNGTQPPLEFYYDEIVPIPLDDKQITLVRAMQSSRSYDELFDQMVTARPRLDENVWACINQRMTDAINLVLQRNMSTTWAITSFFEDFKELVPSLEEDFGEGYTDVLKGHAVATIASTLSVLSGESLVKYLQSHYGQSIDVDNPPILALRKRCSVTWVPWTLSECKLDLSKGGMIPEEKMPELHAAVEAIFKRTPDKPVPFGSRILLTADKKAIALHKGYLGRDVYLAYLNN